ncbi:hypothetical protein B0T13DRAFT_448243 [Neurospora crassa]|nr:hypothetical protein B0T13DRAFT_448243 [Neurospora crassa]
MAPKSRRSVHSSTPIPMPVIAEDESAADTRHEVTTKPTIPPRSPQRRSMSFTRSNGVLSTNSSLCAPSTRPAMYRSTSVPQYVPKRVPGIRAAGGEVGSVRSIPLNSNGTVEWVVPMRDRGREGWTSHGSPAQPVKGKTENRSGRERGGEKEDSILREWVRVQGGWYKVVVWGVLVIGLIVGLAVGMMVGLRKRHHSSEPGPPSPTDLFPAGAYTFTAALTNLSVSCAPKRIPALWRCYPYSLYSPSANESTSAASFRWIIRPTTTFAYVISSSDDPFSPTGIFRDVSLTMIDANQPSERFTFGFTMTKAVVPDLSTTSGSSSSSVSSTRRQYAGINQPAVRGTIWTRMGASYPAKISDVSTPLINATNVYAPWPFAVELTFEQTYEEDESGKGKKAPDCRDAEGKPVVFGNNDNMKAVGERGMNIADEADICRCSYANYGLDTITSIKSGKPQGQSQSQGLD